MGKPKRKNKSELEYLRGIIRELEKENRQLRKRVREVEKKEHFFEKEPELEIDQPKIDACPDCGKGTVNLVIALDHISVFECNICNYRKSLKREKA